MSCTNCSKIRCAIFSLASGIKTTFTEKRYCGSMGASCQFKPKGSWTREEDFGNDFDTLGTFLKFIGRVLIARFRGKTIPTNMYWD